MTPALLFDLDGTLVSSDPLHVRVFVEMFAERGIEIDESYYFSHIHGRHNAHIFGSHFPGADAEALADEKEARFRALLGSEVPPAPGVTALIDEAEVRGWGMAVVTNAPRDNAEAMLAATGLTNRLPELIIGDECTAGKPDPTPYLEALRRLNADPVCSLAFEDSPSGIQSAHSAGLKVIGLRSSLDDTTLRTAGASLTLSDFNDPALVPDLERLRGA